MTSPPNRTWESYIGALMVAEVSVFQVAEVPTNWYKYLIPVTRKFIVKDFIDFNYFA